MARKKLRKADSITLEQCDCGCGLAYLVLRDANGDGFAAAGIPTEDWPRFIAESLEDIKETAPKERLH